MSVDDCCSSTVLENTVFKQFDSGVLTVFISFIVEDAAVSIFSQ